ncbi:MAPEG family protein [Xanthomonas hortorum]|uniref:MAPEG family protein n=1 Tax=Xanthomonas hortorum pv. pelargonii TaxID=453602 RepID=A0A6V7BBA6_9XANT|nr:MAPEG family protein [Xanthomonas hortorum]MCE4355563.1 MAPEG family protein [Xanthomonas hortorum pv. pelargonii]MCM5526575.1 MAPEG family protein [Xanthomonas hortorum pv. pelargonii]MCM5538546.1 MAPEG family protein [Xanthomonas hortorum pv. pelargonii]MCM5542777.1 MAPEG family protein [Xanthomonas hortorum pv. pelargonii]MCM5546902.1 MAPEG family protein [Xanthomonas hortorum pv. pelargonii]
MPIELIALVTTALLCLCMPLLSSALYARQVGAKALIGNREGLPEPSGAAGRAQRAHRNLLENLLPFAAVVLAAMTLQVSTSITVIASLVFLGARVVHAVCYLFGIPGLRTLAYHVGLWATLAYAVQLFL